MFLCSVSEERVLSTAGGTNGIRSNVGSFALDSLPWRSCLCFCCDCLDYEDIKVMQKIEFEDEE